MGYSDRRPAPLASAAPGLLHSAIRCGPTPTLPVGPLLRGTDRGGALGGGGEGPDLAAEAPAEAALEATTQDAETTAEATTWGAEATAEAAAHKTNEPAEASAQTETEAPVTAAQAKAPADAATRKPWWNLFRIATSAPSPSLPSRTRDSPSSSSVMTRLARPALIWPARETPPPILTASGRALPPPP